MSQNTIVNFGAGPSMLPCEVVEAANRLFKDSGNGIGVAELSHRSKEYLAIHQSCLEQLRTLLQVPDTHEILLVPGGATTQFALIPMNFLGDQEHAAYVITGSWSSKAAQHAEKAVQKKQIRRLDCLKETEGGMPTADYISPQLGPNRDIYEYLHITSNNTIRGTQYWQHTWPTSHHVPLVTDASSDILSRPIEWKYQGCVYASAQKNLGIAGVAVVIVLKEWLEKAARRDLPPMLSYKTHADGESLYNTPPTFPITVMKLVLDWVAENGGVSEMNLRAGQRASQLYYALLDRPDYFELVVDDPRYRSRMNLTFTLRDDENGEKTKQFLGNAQQAGLVGLKGHRSVGGIRASMYNAMPIEGVNRLIDFISSWSKL